MGVIKFMWFIPAVIGLILLIWISCTRTDKRVHIDESTKRLDPELICNDVVGVFIYKAGVAIKFSEIDKFRVCNPWPYQYEIEAWIGWREFTIKGGFSSRNEAEDWLEKFLKNSSTVSCIENRKNHT